MTANRPPFLPGDATFPALDQMPRAGSAEQQIALQLSAVEMVEPYRAPSGHPGMRLSNAWLGEHDWRIQMFFYRDLPWEPGRLRNLISAARRRGHATLLGTPTSLTSRPGAVWRLALEEDAIERFFEAYYLSFNLLFPADRSFAVNGNDGDFAVFAGPEAFVREAVPDGAIGAETTAEVVAEVEREHGKGCMEGVLAHYAPFMIEG
ncbi:hypothetical protein [Roseomonas sp. CECT 9278]|uniref:hypothetical protein n=1 Tax=Roseomonas sp. CECT 9278 TaxID=2845823 RepID=UPI001E49BAE2|nr:hypothetical protein [Roseomonas sp. CECT 9278]CAH0258741.1 hypothetical protein ROS9278_03340 [Roseomonas sp. CECT 9278]